MTRSVIGGFRRAAPAGIAAIVAVGAATLGAWLGFHVPHMPALGAVTAIIAANLAANLGLIVLDFRRPAAALADDRTSIHAETLAGAA